MTSVSIILFAYTVENLKRCLECLYFQTLKDMEILCYKMVNSEALSDFLDNYKEKDKRIKIFEFQNLPFDIVKNSGIEAAQGEYIAFLDELDYVDLDFYELLYKKAIKKNADIVKSNLKYVGSKISLDDEYKNIKLFKNDKAKFKHISTSIIKKEFLKKNNIEYLSALNAFNQTFFEENVSKISKKVEIEKKAFYYYVEKNRYLNDYMQNVNVFDFEEKKDLNSKEFKYIVSLTSYKKRIENISYSLYSLINQSKKPDMIVLWLSCDEFSSEKDVPKEILKLCDFGLKIKFTKDIKSYKKLIPALRNFPDDVIVTADDDIFYPEDWFEKLYLEYQKDKRNILCHRAHRITFKNKDEINLYKYWKKLTINKKPSFLNFCTTGGGALFPPHTLYKDVLDENLFMSLAFGADDIWFWAMAVLGNTKIKIIDNPYNKIDKYELFKNVAKKQDSLYWENVVFNDVKLKKLFEYYPELFERLKKA